jgi:hypothetical protein
MVKETSIKLFEEKKVRTIWDEGGEEWYFSVVDVIGILTESENPRRYWSDLKIKLKKEGSQLYEILVQLKLQSSDGKFYNTDVAKTTKEYKRFKGLKKENLRDNMTNTELVLNMLAELSTKNIS